MTSIAGTPRWMNGMWSSMTWTGAATGGNSEPTPTALAALRSPSHSAASDPGSRPKLRPRFSAM